jgi:hypothetical protein
MPINLFSMLIAFGNMTRANSYWWEKRRQNDCNAAISAISDLAKREQGGPIADLTVVVQLGKISQFVRDDRFLHCYHFEQSENLSCDEIWRTRNEPLPI